MEDSSRMPLDHLRRSSDQHGSKRFFRFDPTVSTGTLIQIATIMIGFAIAYGTYREDLAKTRADIELIKVTANRDREDVKAAVSDFHSDVKDIKNDLRDMSSSLAVLKAQAVVQQQQLPTRR